MPWTDMLAIQRVANRRNEVITFRSTGPWAKRWIQAGFPTKGFHVKGKSADWGPQAGLVPWEGRFSKVAPDAKAIKKGNDFNKEGVDHGYAKTIPLVLDYLQLFTQHTVPAGRTSRLAVEGMTKIGGTDDYMLHAVRPNDGAIVPFRACATAGGKFAIYCFSEGAPFDLKSLEDWPRAPLLVMASNEADSDKPMTGDYDLFNICPSWESYGSQTAKTVTFAGTVFGHHDAQRVTFAAGTSMDKVMDPRLHTGTASIVGRPQNPLTDYTNRREAYIRKYQSLIVNSDAWNSFREQLYNLGIVDAMGQVKPEGPWAEHGDMGNLTPRILQCILDLNVEMGSGQMGLTRRVHHNAESHRNRLHNGLKESELEKGDGLPITIFQPTEMRGQTAIAATGYDTIDTIETWEEFQIYENRLNHAGYYVPHGWHWGA